jgi:beta-lactam-binding protein with PASTA domain
MRIILLLITLFMVSCTMYKGLSMKPHKTTVTTVYGQDEVDKANDNKDQTKDSMQLTVKQEFLWKE